MKEIGEMGFSNIFNILRAISIGVISSAVFKLLEIAHNLFFVRFKDYRFIWKRSRSIEPQDVMILRGYKNQGYNEFYFERPHDEEIRRRLADGQHTIIMGQPLSGKTRSFYHALKKNEKDYYVTMPDETKITNASYAVPRFYSFLPCIRRRRILFLDDVQQYTREKKLKSLLYGFQKAGVVIVATCRKGEEEREFLEDEVKYLFGEPIIIPNIESSERARLSNELEKEIGLYIPKEFDGNIGTVFLDLEVIEKRYKEMGDKKRNMLLALQRLRSLGVHRGLYVFDVSWVLSVYCSIYDEGNYKEQQIYTEKFDDLLTELDENGFIRRKKNSIRIEEAYLERIVTEVKIAVKDFKDSIHIFQDDPEALINLAKKAIELGERSLEKEAFMTVAIEALELALKTEITGHIYASAKNSLGIAYRKRSEIRGATNDLETAILCYIDALEVFTPHRFPMSYATAQNNMGYAYTDLAGYHNPVENLERAVRAYGESLKVYTLERTPIDYAYTQNNLGIAYRIFAGYREPVDNLERAVAACEKALEVRTLKLYPIDYAMTQNNLGNVYRDLASYRNPEENLELAVSAFNEALKVYTLERTPMDYAITQNNLGSTYSSFADYREPVENLKRAVAACEEALKVRTLERSPKDYAMTQGNLGIMYRKLAKYHEEPKEYLRKSIKAYQEVLKVFSNPRLLIYYAQTMGNLAITYIQLARLENREEHCQEARRCINEALNIYTEKEFPLDYQRMMRILEAIDEIYGRVQKELK
ncbi:MAG: tetratricopeptide repeat protein [Deltaproteobacteria bacterium]|nr:tetratricopeptide repeat protein [Candidatus Zymogenaceae bacterium]